MTTPAVPTELRTERLLMRVPRPEDAGAIQAAVLASLPELQRWMPWAHAHNTLEDRRQYVETAQQQFDERTELTYGLWLPDGVTFVGNTSLHHLDWQVPRGELGYWVATPHTRHGYAQEAARALTALALETLRFRRLELRCDSRNERSARVARKLGFTLDATFRNDAVRADDPTQLRDTLVFSRVQ